MIPLPNPFEQMGSIAGRLVVEGWTAAMLAVWNAGLWVLQLVLGWVDSLLTPDLSENGPGGYLYRITFWIAAALLLILGLVQLGFAAAKRDGRDLARLGIGLLQFALVWAAWIGYTVLIVAAASGLTRGLMQSLMGVTSWRDWQTWEPINVQDVTDAATATVLGVLGILVWIAAIAHVVMMLTRAAALMVIVATTPIAAAGLATETTRVWFWRSLRWFHAAALAPPVTVMVTGVGMKFAEGVAAGQANGPLASIATAIPAVVLICIASFAPMALFRLLAFVDPGTASGAAARAGLAAAGGVQGLLRGNPTESTAAAQADDNGRSSGETSAEAATSARVTNTAAAGLGVLGGPAAVAAAGLQLFTKVGVGGAAMLADGTNLMGTGHNAYYPDQPAPGDDARANNRDTRTPEQSPTPAPPRTPTGNGSSTLSTTGSSGGGAAAGGAEAAETAAIAL